MNNYLKDIERELKDRRHRDEEERLRKAGRKMLTLAVASIIIGLGANQVFCNNRQNSKPNVQHSRPATTVSLDKKVQDMSGRFKREVDNFGRSLARTVDDVVEKINPYRPLLDNASKVLGDVYKLKNLTWFDLVMLPCAETGFRNYDMTPPDIGYVQMTRAHYEWEVVPELKKHKALRQLFGGRIPAWHEIANRKTFNLLAGAISFAKYVREYADPRNNPYGADPRILAISAYNAGEGRIDRAVATADDMDEVFKNLKKVKSGISHADAMRGAAWLNTLKKEQERRYSAAKHKQAYLSTRR